MDDLKYSKYEMARILGARALQISMGAPFLVKIGEKELKEINFNPIEIAKREFKENVIPITVKRPYPVSESYEEGKKEKEAS
ncbi:DNA-directed RNA polymerase subunit K [Candidatus Woesearchaeota archaeon]|nr:DNA-directed RNA polymerase subunit K [Candidatus Woesearchaeota archaeon]